MIEDEGDDFGYAKTCMMTWHFKTMWLQKNIIVGLCPNKSPLTTCQAFELHDGNRLRHRVIENSLR
jgi:hypothetical protein